MALAGAGHALGIRGAVRRAGGLRPQPARAVRSQLTDTSPNGALTQGSNIASGVSGPANGGAPGPGVGPSDEWR